jgi:hypothetical protein
MHLPKRTTSLSLCPSSVFWRLRESVFLRLVHQPWQRGLRETYGCGRRSRTFSLCVQSAACCQLHHPAIETSPKSQVQSLKSVGHRDFGLLTLDFGHHWSGHWDSNPEPCAYLALTPLIRRLLCPFELCPAFHCRFPIVDCRFCFS